MFVSTTKMFSGRANKKVLLLLATNLAFYNSCGISLSAQALESGHGTVEFNVHQPAAKVDPSAEEIENAEANTLPEEQNASTEQIEANALKCEIEKDIKVKADTAKAATDKKPGEKSTFVLQGGVTYTVPRGTPIKLKLATVPTHPMNLGNRDLDGNLFPAKLGQEITARISEDIYVGQNKIIPEGSVLAGHVSKILPPRRVYRPGTLEMSFTKLITPDGRTYAFRAQADNFKKSTLKTKAKGFGIIAAHAAGGAIVGAIIAYDICGMHYTIAMHGYNIAGGAAAGALIATGYAIMRHGPEATLEPGDDLHMFIDANLLMPAADEKVPETKKAEVPELRIQVEKSKIARDGLGGHFVTVDANLINDSDTSLSSIDLFLEDTNGNRHPLCSSPEEQSQFLFYLEPHSQKHVHLSFLTEFPKLKQQLVWVDHESKSTLVKQKVQ